MRSSLIGSLVSVLRHNLARKAARVRVFELGRVFRRDASVRKAPERGRGRRASRCAWRRWPIGPADSLQWGRKERAVDFFDVKGDLEALLAPRQPLRAATHPALHPGRCAAVEARRARDRPRGRTAPAVAPGLRTAAGAGAVRTGSGRGAGRAGAGFTAVPRQQPVVRDLALVVGDQA
jgi:phenylalanyl-tRNA synthetase beta chain